MRARQLEIFAAVMRAGTVTEAARQLNISQPALSQVLRQAEAELGFALFDREKGRLKPTPEALELYPDAARLLGELEGLKRRTTDLRLGRAGLVRIGCSTPAAMSVLPQALAAFRTRHPEITLRCNVAQLSALRSMLREGDIACAIALTDRPYPELELEILGETGFVCLLPEGHPLGAQAELGFADLAGEVVISYHAATRPFELLDAAARRAGQRFAPALEIDTSISVVGFVQAGLGIAVVDGLLPWQKFAGLVARPLAEAPRLPAALLTLRGRPLSRAEEILCSGIRQLMRPARRP